jgi:dTDP-4-amino-4,6-dideoxygalactose transaminase
MGIGENDEVIIPSYVCTALLNAVYYVGARPVLADVDPGTYNLDPKDVRARLTGRTKAVIVPHLFGLSADMQDLLSLGVPIIEDCAQAVGGSYQGKPVGTFGRMAIFSFYATKVMTTGEGGMVTSDSKELIDQVKDLREYDKNKTYHVRYNYKMTDIQAAMGRVQLSRLGEFIRRRRKIAKSYQKALESFDFKLPPHQPGHIYYRYVIEFKIDSTSLIRKLMEKGIACARPVHMPLHLILNLKDYSITESVWRRSISIPLYPSLSDSESEQVIAALKDLYPEVNCGR